ncbi:MAG: hypothetical protein AAGL17_12210 [Cyanobacteria bacterium J06576_12]
MLLRQWGSGWGHRKRLKLADSSTRYDQRNGWRVASRREPARFLSILGAGFGWLSATLSAGCFECDRNAFGRVF